MRKRPATGRPDGAAPDPFCQPPRRPMEDRDSNAAPARPWWRQKEPVHRIGYILSAIWMAGIVIATNGDTGHFLFNFIFTVPLAGWVIGLVAAALLRRAERNRDR